MAIFPTHDLVKIERIENIPQPNCQLILITAGPVYLVLSLKKRKDIVYLKVLSIVEYGLPLYIGQTNYIKDKLTTIYRLVNLAKYGMPLPYNTRNSWICHKIGVKTTEHLIVESASKLMHKIINMGRPKQIFDLLKFQSKFRCVARISVKKPPRTKTCRICSTQYGEIYAS